MIFDAIWRKERLRNKVAKAYDKEIKEKEKAKDHEGEQMLLAEASQEVGDFDNELWQLISQTLVKKARQLRLALPPFSDKESWDDFWGVHTLTEKAYAELR